MHRIAVIEDDINLQHELRLLLTSHGCDVTTIQEGTFHNCASFIVESGFDLVLVDLGLPGIDGRELCRFIRECSNVPLMVLTAQNEVIDEVMSLQAGANDFLAKPFNPHVLLARIDVLLREEHTHLRTQLAYKGLVLHLGTCQASYKGKSCDLTKNELILLRLLLEHPEYVVTRKTMQHELWQSDQFVDDNTLSVNISHLRSTLSTLGLSDIIHTKRGIGYVIS